MNQLSLEKVFEDRSIKIYLLTPVGFSSNVYAIVDRGVVIVDTGVGDRANRILLRLREIGVSPSEVRTVVLTHEHFDHVGGLREIEKGCSPIVVAHRSTAGWLSGRYDLDFCEARDGAGVPFHGYLRVLHTPGHSEGSICLYDEGRRLLFSGDTVFADGWFGRTDLPTGSDGELVRSLGRLRGLKVDVVFPGHGQVDRDGDRCIRVAHDRAAGTLY